MHGTYRDANAAYRLKIKVHLRTNLFTVSIIASPENKGTHDSVIADEKEFEFRTIGFWNEFSERMGHPFSIKRFFAGAALQNIFADSRGIIISSYSIAASRKAHTAFDARSGWAEPVVKHLAPILSPLKERGCTATYMLDRQAVTATTFGSQPLSQLGRERFPLTFVICVHGDLLEKQGESWARLMGYVLSRSHTITTMRLAALLDLGLLRDASTEMAKFDDIKMRARKSIKDYEDDEKWGGRARVDVEALGGHIGKINSTFLNDNPAGIGLTFRIESSKFYIAEFHKHVEALRLSQSDGYQSYSQVIEGNIGITFEFISRLGVRYDRMLTESTSIVQNFLAAQTRHARNLVTEIQIKGEIILIGVLAPYYGIGLISHIIGEHSPLAESLLLKMIYAGIWASLGSFALYRALISKFGKKSLRTKTAKRLCAIAVAALGFAFLAFWYWELKNNDSRPQASPAHQQPKQVPQRG